MFKHGVALTVVRWVLVCFTRLARGHQVRRRNTARECGGIRDDAGAGRAGLCLGLVQGEGTVTGAACTAAACSQRPFASALAVPPLQAYYS